MPMTKIVKMLYYHNSSTMQRDKLKNSNTSQTTESDSSNCNIQEALKKNPKLKIFISSLFHGKKIMKFEM